MVPRAGFEPAASPLGGVRSIRLSYRGILQKNSKQAFKLRDFYKVE